MNFTPGFTSLDECIKFCDSIGFDYSIAYYDLDGKSMIVVDKGKKI